MNRIAVLLGWLLSCASFAGPTNGQFFQPANQQQDWVRMWSFNGQSDSQIATQLDYEIQMIVVAVDRICDLDDAAEAKLRTAGQCDIRRFFRDVDRVRDELSETKFDPSDNDAVQKAWQVVSPLSTRIQSGLFSKGSLYRKVMETALTAEQRDAFHEHERRDRQRRQRIYTRSCLVEIERAMPLLSDQRTKLLELMDAVPMPKTWSTNMEGQIGNFQLVKIDENKLKDILDEHQWKVVKAYRQQFGGWVGVE